jgi:hypothetical protein
VAGVKSIPSPVEPGSGPLALTSGATVQPRWIGRAADEEASMGDGEGTAEQKVDVPFLADPESWALLMVTSLNVGRGEPGPGDEWKFPGRLADEADDAGDVVAEPGGEGGGVGLLHRLTRRH